VERSRITPLVLTYNEAPNIGRTLDQLGWAQQVVLVDSYSTDGTLDIASQYPQVQIFQREFDHFAAQCNYGLDQVETEWVLSLDADYVLSDELIAELAALPDQGSVNGYRVSFVYCVFGEPLRATLYPPRTVLYRKDRASYKRDGHAHRVRVKGTVAELDSVIYHDDRKPLDRWLDAQKRYVDAERGKYRDAAPEELSLPDRLRQRKWAPLFIFFYCLFGQGLVLDGKAGWYYTFQRTYAELLLAISLMDEELRPP
jgi:glycosyltransferase involved in cell wall biosynthesis